MEGEGEGTCCDALRHRYFSTAAASALSGGTTAKEVRHARAR